MLTYRRRILSVVMGWMMSAPVWAGDFYVDQNDLGASDQNSGSIGQPWKTIAKANNTLVAGDTVYIKAGTYSDATIAPVHSGTSEGNRITYRNYEDDVVIISNAATSSVGLRLDAKSYITVHGINFTQQHRFLYIRDGSSHNNTGLCA